MKIHHDHQLGRGLQAITQGEKGEECSGYKKRGRNKKRGAMKKGKEKRKGQKWRTKVTKTVMQLHKKQKRLA